MKEEKEITVVWHVYDLMISCQDNFELTKFSCYLANIYGPKLAMHLGINMNTSELILSSWTTEV